jgi:hypothetical protein
VRQTCRFPAVYQQNLKKYKNNVSLMLNGEETNLVSFVESRVAVVSRGVGRHTRNQNGHSQVRATFYIEAEATIDVRWDPYLYQIVLVGFDVRRYVKRWPLRVLCVNVLDGARQFQRFQKSALTEITKKINI